MAINNKLLNKLDIKESNSRLLAEKTIDFIEDGGYTCETDPQTKGFLYSTKNIPYLIFKPIHRQQNANKGFRVYISKPLIDELNKANKHDDKAVIEILINNPIYEFNSLGNLKGGIRQITRKNSCIDITEEILERITEIRKVEESDD